ncbi:RRD2 [Candida metapsilosis]|uniref:Serine/threonine-protein phosphatase 2A activator n=1 Tax=Candida metapsilosis TaxID=273372 RepID=A0A8H8D9E3_9ASCO|nr:RRD2 [Candida metapsilosis]
MYFKPVRRVFTQDDLSKWIESDTYKEVLEFITQLQDSVTDKANDDPVATSPVITKLIHLIEEIYQIIQRHPVTLEKDISRFGKIEFRDFYDEVEANASTLIEPICDTALIETSTYLTNSWGDRTRIDYGSGHELNFICFLLCLYKLGIIKQEDFPALILQVFTKYMSTMRCLQRTYWLEPAGSHGVWGLDDYHFLPFLFGGAQLCNHPHMKPKSIHNDELVEMYKDKYIYMECINFINNIKTSTNTQQDKLSLRWHSPMLDDISSAKSWSKIKEGMVKMYKVEVLGKLPIIQHFMFGELLKCPEGIPGHQHEVEDCGHVHEVTNTWGDCCGIKVPSAIAASESIKRGIPFD